MRRTTLLCALALLAPAAVGAVQAQAAQATQAPPAAQYHVVEVQNSDSITVEQLLEVITGKLGASKEKAMPLIERIDKYGKAVVVAGSKDACEEAAQHFTAIGLKTEVRPLSASDIPTVYDDSDVIPAGATKLKELLETGEGVLVTFYAPWCGHCKTMVEDFKQAATTLKSEGIRVAAVDGQASPAVAQQLGVRGYPTIMWLHMATKEGDEQPTITIAPHNGRRDAASFVEFAKAASKATALRSKLPQGDAAEAGASPGDAAGSGAEASKSAAATAESESAEALSATKTKESSATKSKLGASKVGASKLGGGGNAVEGMQKAKMPAEAAAEKTEPEQATEAEPVKAA